MIYTLKYLRSEVFDYLLHITPTSFLPTHPILFSPLPPDLILPTPTHPILFSRLINFFGNSIESIKKMKNLIRHFWPMECFLFSFLLNFLFTLEYRIIGGGGGGVWNKQGVENIENN